MSACPVPWPSTTRRPIIRSGYVYVAHSQEWPDVCKVGRTSRPPHARVAELGRTTWLMPMQVAHARYFWDCVKVEAFIHQMLGEFLLREDAEEWFALPSWQVRSMLVQVEEGPVDCREVFDEMLDWSLDMIASPNRLVRDAGWRDLERLSAQGSARASWILSEHLLDAYPTEPDKALWPIEAALAQGHPFASLRRDWIASVAGFDPTRRRWMESATRFLDQNPDPSNWTPEDADTIARECFLWNTRPSMEWGSPVHRRLVYQASRR